MSPTLPLILLQLSNQGATLGDHVAVRNDMDQQGHRRLHLRHDLLVGLK